MVPMPFIAIQQIGIVGHFSGGYLYILPLNDHGQGERRTGCSLTIGAMTGITGERFTAEFVANGTALTATGAHGKTPLQH
jgi:hypothetical protein